MERSEISLHQIKVYRFVRDSAGWVDNSAIAKATGVSGRTARLHTKTLVSLGIFDQAELFPGHRFRMSSFAEKRNKAYLRRLSEAEKVFGL